jgi:hypothetical protein
LNFIRWCITNGIIEHIEKSQLHKRQTGASSVKFEDSVPVVE